MTDKHCKHCWACDHCGHCRKCGRLIAAPMYPVYPMYPTYPLPTNDPFKITWSGYPSNTAAGSADIANNDSPFYTDGGMVAR